MATTTLPRPDRRPELAVLSIRTRRRALALVIVFLFLVSHVRADAAPASPPAVHPAPGAPVSMEAEQAFAEARRLDQAGRDAEALSLAQRACALWEQPPGQETLELARCLALLGKVALAVGHRTQSASALHRALPLLETRLGEKHLEVAAVLECLIKVFADDIDYTIRLSERILKIREAVQGKYHPDVLTAWLARAGQFTQKGQADKAVQIQKRVLHRRAIRFGKNHLEVAKALVNLANTYFCMGQYARAEPLARRSLRIFGAMRGAARENYIMVALTNLGLIYGGLGRYPRAVATFKEVIRRMEVKKDPHLLSVTLSYLADNHLALGQVDQALPLLQRDFVITEQLLREEVGLESESILLYRLGELSGITSRILRAVRQQPSSAAACRWALASTLLVKGRSARELADISHTLYSHLAPADQEGFTRLQALRREVTQLSFGDCTAADCQERRSALLVQVATLEQQLAAASAPLRTFYDLPRPEEVVERVTAALPPGHVLIELVVDQFLRRVHEPRPKGIYALTALLLFADGHTAAVDLGPMEPIAQAVAAVARPDAQRDSLAAWQALYRQVFQPLEPHLGAATQLVLSPDGALNTVSFAALHDGQRFLVDRFDLSYVNSGRDLLPPPQAPPPGQEVVVFAAPDLQRRLAAEHGTATRSMPGEQPAQAALHGAQADDEAEERAASPLTAFWRDQAPLLSAQPWDDLPGARSEAEHLVERLPQARSFFGAQASRDALVQITAPRLLHIATHGFYLSQPPAGPGSRGRKIVPSVGTLRAPAEPMLRSGLILAGAEPITAWELAGLNLWGTELVVLAACQSGLGDVNPADGQGVFGLRRAFAVAGAGTLVTSLWNVDDRVTAAWMDAFYEELLRGRTPSQAVSQAMLIVRATHREPRDWAAFLAVGRNQPVHLAP